MSRIRTIKPEFWSNEQVMECSTTARLLFIGLWNFADDAGRHALAYKQIKALVFPGDDISTDTIQELFGELSTNNLLITYIADNKEFFQITGWHHQKIDKPRESKIPPPSGIVAEHSTNVRTGREGKVVEGNGREKKDGDAGAPKVGYAFEGSIIRLKLEQLAKWKVAYKNISDWPATLTKADDYYSQNPPKDGKWFFPLSGWLERENKQSRTADHFAGAI